MASTFYRESLDGNPNENKRIRAYILYFLGCLYYKIDNFLEAKQKFEECINLKPEADLQKTACDLLNNIMVCQVKPPWWEWWLCYPIHKWRRRILFGIILISIISLTIFHPLIYSLTLNNLISRLGVNYSKLLDASENFPTDILSPINWTIYLFALLSLASILLFPRIEQIVGKGIAIQIQTQKTTPIAEFNLPMPPFRFERSCDIDKLRKSSRMFLPPARKLAKKWTPAYPEFMGIYLRE